METTIIADCTQTENAGWVNALGEPCLEIKQGDMTIRLLRITAIQSIANEIIKRAPQVKKVQETIS